jgi:DNA repair exonuclease SbcCD ATPase subunit
MNTYNTLIREKENKIIELKKRLEKVEKMIGFVINLNETIKVKTIGHIEEVVTKSLNQIFKVNFFKFKISFDTHGTTPVSNFYLIENDVEKDVINSFGGGVADIVGIVLRLVLLELQYPKNTAPVILDETGKFISNDYQASFSDFLKNWSTTFKRQIIIISHKTEVMGFSDRIIEIKKDKDSFPIIKK